MSSFSAQPAKRTFWAAVSIFNLMILMSLEAVARADAPKPPFYAWAPTPPHGME